MNSGLELIFGLPLEPVPHESRANACIWCLTPPEMPSALILTPLGDACQAHAPEAIALAAGAPPPAGDDRLGPRRRHNWLL